MRTAARLTLMLLLAALTAFIAGCGSDDATSSKTSGTDRAASNEVDEGAPEGEEQPATIEASLEIELTNVGGKDFAGIPVPAAITCTRSSPATCSGTVECPATGEDAADGEEMCRWLASTGARVLLDEPGQAGACTQQYGGPEVARVTGTIGEESVDATFSREDGCAIARFDEASPLWTGEFPASAPTAAGAASGSCPAQDPDAPVASDADARSADRAAGAADAVCGSPATSAPTPAPGTPLLEPEVISDPPEAFELEK